MLRTVLLLVVALLVCVPVVLAGAIADSIAFQGQLSDAADAPLNGTYVMILSLWSDSTGGTMLHSEDQSVSVSKGLFSVCVGCVGLGLDADALSSSPQLWLQVQVAGQPPMVPRTRFRSVPKSVLSSRVRGDITTSPNQITVGDLDGDGYLDLASPPDQSEMRVAHKRAGKVKYNNITMRAMADSVRDWRDCDSDDDGTIDSRMALSLGHGGGGAGGLILIEADLDGDGSAESSSSSSSTDSGSQVSVSSRFAAGPRQTTSMDGTFSHAGLRCDTDSDNDGVADHSVSSLTTSSSAKHAINTKGTGSSGRSISSSTSPTNAIILIEADLDGDGFTENSIGGDCDDTDADFRIAHEAAHVIQQKAGAAGASLRITSDHDADGVEDRRISNDCDDTDASISIDEPGVHVAITTNPDSTVFDNERTMSDHKVIHRDLAARNILLSSRSWQTDLDTASIDMQIDSSNGGSARLAIKTKGTSAKRFSAGGDCDDGDAVLYTDCDDDGDGLSESSVSQSSSSDAASLSLDARTGMGGLMGPRMSTNLSIVRPTQQSSFGQACDVDNDGVSDVSTLMRVTPTSASLAINSKGTSAKRVTAQADADSACIAIDEPGVHVAMSSKGWDGTIKGNVHITDGVDRTVNFDGDGIGFVSKRFGIGATDPVNPLRMASGAVCTPGGVWTNASDVNLKENFQPIDGQELLEKIEQLPISEWNYRNESDDVKHIGPTAQDFKDVFGVGVNDKTISTIDPSGIALAAIKELNKQNRELKDQNADLQRQLDDLKKAVADLRASR